MLHLHLQRLLHYPQQQMPYLYLRHEHHRLHHQLQLPLRRQQQRL
ncbi:MAG: hypothetical protein OIF38_03960 [Cellvibrionaceae bacterium]|nr:hypothetical protein [Cellvibrionaceae bacterium]